jgi:TPR repeat protein
MIPAEMKLTLIALLTLFLSLPLVAADKDKPFPKDFKSLKALAEKGDARAQFNLGLMYGFGMGVIQDYVTAYAWANIAAANGSKTAIKLKSGFLEKKMTPDQIAEAQKLSRELLRKIEANKAGKPKPSDLPFARPLIDQDTGLPIIERR